MADNWADLETRLHAGELEAFVNAKVVPHLCSVGTSDAKSRMEEAKKKLSRGFSVAFFGFAIFFIFVATALPDHWYWVVFKFVIFPLGFFGALALAAYLNRRHIGAFLVGRSQSFVARSAAMAEIADRFGLTYVPSPGGAPESLKLFARLGFLKDQADVIIETLNDHGGMDEAVKIATDSGLLKPDAVVLGSENDKARYYRQTAMAQAFEDGLEGERNGIRFSAFEWVETVDEAPNLYHLLIVLTPPTRLTSVTQLRSRKTPWPANVDGVALHPVHLLPEAFDETFRLRGSDQVEARTIFNPAVVERTLKLAHGDRFRAVAREDGLVFDFVGANRFNLLNLDTDEWSLASIRQAMTDLADLLDLIDEMAHTFMVRA